MTVGSGAGGAGGRCIGMDHDRDERLMINIDSLLIRNGLLL